jgi:creatinine amidohydrolase
MNLTEMTWPAVDGLDRKTPVVLPIAAMEQHGRHMPLFTDSLLLGEVVRRVQQQPVASRVLFAPLQWLGNSHHHLDMPGTLSASPRVYLDLLHDLAEAVLAHGFCRIIFLNGHGGNTTPSQQAAFELRQKYRQRRDLLLLAITYWDSIDPRPSVPGLVQSQMGHACEWETSMMLALRPELVDGDLSQVPDVPFGEGAAPGYRGWTTPDRSQPGHIGRPSAASAEKGEGLLGAFAAGVAGFLERTVAWSGSEWNL